MVGTLRVPYPQMLTLQKENWKVVLGGGLRSVFYHEVKRSRCHLTEAAISVKGNSDRDGGIVASELHSAIEKHLVKFVYVKGSSLLPQNESAGLSDGPVRKSPNHRRAIPCTAIRDIGN